MNRLKGQAGFTLIEMVLACTLVVTITLAVLPLIWQTKVMLQQGQKQIELHNSLQIGMADMTNDLLNCERLTFIDPYKGYQPASDSKQLSFISAGKTTRYYVGGSGQLLRTFKGTGGSTALPINQHITGLKVEYYDSQGQPILSGAKAAEVVRVQLTLNACIEGTVASSLTSSVTLRVPVR